MRRALMALASAQALALAWPAAAEIGAVGAANDLTTGQPPAAEPRQLVIAQPVVQNERIVANDNGLAQLIFLDRSTLTVSPNSDVILDRYVFDPEAGAGDIAVSLTKGALRFIGGAITKTRDGTINAPGAVIALRGALVTVDTNEERTRVVLWAGEYARITAPGGVLTLSRPGAVGIVDLRQPGAAPVYDGIIEEVEAAGVLGTFRSQGNGGVRTAGLGETPGETFVAGGSDSSPVSTAGEIAAIEDPGEGFFDRVALALDQQTTTFTDFERLGVENMDFVDIGGDGPVRGQLTWRTDADLDLYLILPNDLGTVFFSSPRISVGEGSFATLDQDNRGGPIDMPPDLRVENIVVTGDNIPEGRYVYFVDLFNGRNNPENDFQLNATGDSGRTVRSIRGVLTTRGQDSERLPVDFTKD